MKKITIVLAVTLLASLSYSPVFAKKQRDVKRSQQQAAMRERKLWKKRQAKMSPMEFKKIVQRNRFLEERAKFLANQVLDYEKYFTEIVPLRTIESYHDDHMQGILHDQASKQALQKRLLKDVKDMLLNDRVVMFKVQIGAYVAREFFGEVSEEDQSYAGIDQEKLGTMNKYTLGYFINYKKADQLKKELRAMGIKDAWVVAFKHGVRVPLSEVVDAIAD